MNHETIILNTKKSSFLKIMLSLGKNTFPSLILSIMVFSSFNLLIVDIASGNSDIPEVDFIYPVENALVKKTLNITWLARDLDGSNLDIVLYYSNENDDDWIRINDEPLENDGIHRWDCSNLIDGHYQLYMNAVDFDNNIGHDKSGVFTIDNDNSLLSISSIMIKDTTIDSTEFVKNGDAVEISAKILHGAHVHKEDISADLSCFVLSNNVPPDSFDGSTAIWTLPYITCATENGILQIDIDVDTLVQASKTIISDNLPPDLEIIAPRNGLYILQRKLFSIESIFVIGKIPILLEASDNFGIENIKIYVDNELYSTLNKAPYDTEINRKMVGFHNINVKIIDKAHNDIDISFTVFCFNLL